MSRFFVAQHASCKIFILLLTSFACMPTKRALANTSSLYCDKMLSISLSIFK